MADNFQSSKVATNEQSSSTKFNNFVQDVENAVNSIANSNVSSGAAIAVSKLAAGTNGDTLQTVGGVPVWAAGAGAPGYGTTLPGSPTNGQEAILVDSTTSPTYAWRFRFNTGSAHTDKWEFLGGSSLSAEADADVSTASGTYVDLGSGTPAVTVLRAGVYEVHFGSAIRNTLGNNHGYAAIKVGAAATSDNDSVQNFHTGASVEGGAAARVMQITAAASDVLKMQYRSDGGATNGFTFRFIKVVPLRVS